MFHMIWSIIVGFIVGYVARAIMPEAQHLDLVMTIVLGIAGSFLGGLIGQLVSRPASGAKFHPAGIVMSLIGALILLYLYTRFGQ